LKLDPEVKAIVCSGYGDHPIMSNYKEYGFRTALTKPFLKASLDEALRKTLG
jgi:FixJ family two-component response regulator